VGSPLVNALIFVAVASSFYASIATLVPSVDANSPEFRSKVAPLNHPQGVSEEIAAAAGTASTDAFHLAMLVSAGLLVAGAAVNAVGIRNPAPTGRRGGPGGEQPPPDGGAEAPGGPVRGTRERFASEPAARRPTGPAADTPPPGG
jgi:hypothetical protein